MSKASGITFMPEMSIDLEPDALTLYDLSRYNSNGTMGGAGTPNAVQLPSRLWTWDFANTNYIALGTEANNLDLTGSIAAWIRPATGIGTQGIIISHGAGWNRPGWIVSTRDTTRIRFQWQAGADRNLDSALNTAVADTWLFVVCTHDGTTMRIYADAVQDVSTLANAESALTDLNGYMGYEFTQTALPFLGCISVYKVLTYALTQGQITNMYEKTKHWFGVHD